METAQIALILVLIVLAVIGFYLTSVPVVELKSTLIIAVKDAPKQSEFGTISSLSLTFSEVSVHKASAGETINETTEEMSVTESNETEETGWITVVDEVQTVDLLQLIDISEVLGQKDLDPGKYTQIRLRIDSGTVTIDGETYDVTIPSKVLKLNRGFELESNTVLKLTLDFNVEKSLVKTGKDKFKLKPVIAVISEVITTTAPITTTSPIITTTTILTTTAPPTTTVTTTTQVTTSPIAAEGILLMKIKDKLDLTNITAINITIDKVEVHKAGNDDETQSNETFETNNTSSAGWDTVVDETKSYNLLELVDTSGEVLGETTLSAGKYTQIRLSVVEAKLTLNNESYDVKVPSKRFYWVHPFNIESGKITTLTLDFDAADSIKETGSNKYILKPVVKIIGEISTTTTTITTTTTTTTTIPTIDIDLTLNGTQGDFYYKNETYANFTVTADATVLANLTTNMTEWTDKSSITPYYEYPLITCDVNDTWYNVTAFTGNNSWKYDYETHYAICYVTSSTTTTVPENSTTTTVS